MHSFTVDHNVNRLTPDQLRREKPRDEYITLCVRRASSVGVSCIYNGLPVSLARFELIRAVSEL
jgi:hypothetical protein